jgi:DNA-binding transcriptional LysR family regulator
MPVRDLEVAELRAFCESARLGSIARAARGLHVSQPALSKRLRGLEAVAGTQLFQRSTRGVTLTPAGAQLYTAARRLLADADAVQALLSEPVPITAPVRIAASPTVAEFWLPQVLMDLAGPDSRLQIELMTASSAAVREAVHERRCDVGFAAVNREGTFEPGLSGTVIWDDEIVIAVPVGHPWAALEQISPEEFARTPVIDRDVRANSTAIVAEALEEVGLTRVPPMASLGSTAAMIAAAMATRTPVLLPLLAARDQDHRGFFIRRVTDLRFTRRFALIWAGALSELPPGARAFAEHLVAGRPLTPGPERRAASDRRSGSEDRRASGSLERPFGQLRPQNLLVELADRRLRNLDDELDSLGEPPLGDT